VVYPGVRKKRSPLANFLTPPSGLEELRPIGVAEYVTVFMAVYTKGASGYSFWINRSGYYLRPIEKLRAVCENDDRL